MKKLLPLFLATTAVLAHSAFGQTATTTPVGAMTYTIAQGSVAAPKISSFSVPLFGEMPQGFVGSSTAKITGVTSNTLTCTGAAWSANALSQATSPFLVRIKSGAGEGYVFQISANSAETLTVLTDGADLTTLGIATSGESQDVIELHPADTLLTFFGVGTVDGAGNTVMGGTSTANADLVTIHNGSGWKTYYYNISVGHWREGNFTRDTTILLPRMGITYQRRGTSPFSFVLTGAVPDSDLRCRVNNLGVNYISLGFPQDVVLGNSGIQNMPGFVKNTGNLATADKVLVWNGSAWKSYNYNSSVSQWREGNFNRNTTVIPAGTPIQIVRGSPVTGSQIWTLPLPYSL